MISSQVANSDSHIHPSGYLNTRLSDGAGNGFAARSIPFTGFPSKISSSWPIDTFYDMKHIKVRTRVSEFQQQVTIKDMLCIHA